MFAAFRYNFICAEIYISTEHKILSIASELDKNQRNQTKNRLSLQP